MFGVRVFVSFWVTPGVMPGKAGFCIARANAHELRVSAKSDEGVSELDGKNRTGDRESYSSAEASAMDPIGSIAG